MENLFTFLILASFICIILSVIKPSMFRFLPWNQSRAKTALTFVGCCILFFILFGATLPSNHSTKSQASTPSVNVTKSIKPAIPISPTTQPITTSPSPTKPNYTIVDKRNLIATYGTIHYFFILINPSDDNKAQNIANYIVKNECGTMPLNDWMECEVTLYDDSNALSLDEYYSYNGQNLTTSQQNAWEKKNDVFIANHTIGELQYNPVHPNEGYTSYPYKGSETNTPTGNQELQNCLLSVQTTYNDQISAVNSRGNCDSTCTQIKNQANSSYQTDQANCHKLYGN